MDWKKISDKVNALLKKEKSNAVVWGIVILAAVGIVLLSIPWPDKAQETQTVAAASASAEEDDLETRMEQILSTVDSAGKVKVLITYASGPSIVPVMSSDRQENTSQDSGSDSSRTTTSTTESSTPATVQSSDGSEPMVMVEYSPEILGVLIIAEGADDLSVKLRLQSAVQTVLQLPVDKIEVLPMETHAE